VARNRFEDAGIIAVGFCGHKLKIFTNKVLLNCKKKAQPVRIDRTAVVLLNELVLLRYSRSSFDAVPHEPRVKAGTTSPH
jgi:hypothetical protein